MRNLKYDTNEFIYETETDAQTQRPGSWLPRWVGGRDELGGWGQQIQAVIYRMDNQKGPTGQHEDLYSMPCNKPLWTRI